MLTITDRITIEDHEVVMTAMASQGAGGQNVNKVATAIHLRFDIRASSLPEELKERLLGSRDHRVTREGVIIIKAQRYRQQEKNRADALERLCKLIRGATLTRPKRKATKPTRGARQRRLEKKNQRSQTKNLRKKIDT
ncbi:MAG: aminoacyl-tRNA hydrolase [Desulfuromonas sp.]|nr:MAG: aminoacyl-tRNA hydrolase [Desulfuromonas sp.]